MATQGLATAPKRGNHLTFESIVAGVRRRLPLFLAVFSIVLGAVLLYGYLQPRTYEATSRVLVDQRPRSVTPSPEVMGELPQKDDNVVGTEVEIIQSRELAERVVRVLNLDGDPEFGREDTDSTVEAVSRAINIRRAGETYLIDISVRSRDPNRAAELANVFAREYIGLQQETRRAATENANALLLNQLQRLEDEVRVADASLQQFRIKNNLLSVNGATLAEQTAANLDQDLARARAQAEEAGGRSATLQTSGGTLDTANAQASLGTLRADQASARQALSEAEVRYGPRHPAYAAARERVQEIDRAIAAEMQRARAAAAATRQQQLNQAQAEAVAAAQRRNSLSSSAAQTRSALQRNTRAAVELNELQRRADSVRETYQAYLNRYQQNLSSLGSEQADVRIVAAAVANDQPVAPNRRLLALVGVLLGLAAGFGAALLLTLLDTRLSTPREVENALDVDTLPSIATLVSTEGKAALRRGHDPVSFIVAEPLSAFAEQFRNLLAALLSRSADGKAKVLALTSALPGEGKTTTTVCTAAVAALGGRRTILIDCDIRRRSASQIVEQRSNRGLVEVLKREATLQEAVIAHLGAGFDVLPLSTATIEARDLLGSPAMEGLIAELRATYDLILLDTPPVLPVADTRLLVRHIDVTGLLVRWRSTPGKAAEAALDIIAETAPNIAGAALSMVDLRKQTRQGYGDPAFYHKKYKNYYSVSATT